MNTYKITVKKAGEIIKEVMVTATNALTAISFVEDSYQAKKFTLSDKAGQVQHHHWTGYEFQARRIELV